MDTLAEKEQGQETGEQERRLRIAIGATRGRGVAANKIIGRCT